MAGETTITVVGNCVQDPELKFTNSGHALVNFTVASTPRYYDKQQGQYVDGEALFMRCTAWRQMAENIGETLTKGTRVVVQGRLRQRSFETKEGEKRTVMELDVDEIGPSLRFATAKVNKVGRSSGADSHGWSSAGGRGSDDPWGASPAGAGAPMSDEPPF